jgi:hypothetical protein
MRFFRACFIWTLVALWLPAVLHCAMDQAGIGAAAQACCSDDQRPEAASEDHCLSDHCETLDSYLLHAGIQSAPTVGPVLLLDHWDSLLAALQPLAVPSISPPAAESPPELPRTWQFTYRAAPSPRAPGLAS